MDTEYIEQHLEERIKAAKAKAQRIKKAIDIYTVEDAELVLRFVLSRHYNMPLFDKYFDDRTLDELFFEAELVLPEKAASDNASAVIEDNKEEVTELINDFEEWIDKTDEPLDPAVEGDPFFDMAKKFMETGDFAGTGSNKAPADNNKEEINYEERTDLG